jgi:hypothetical protein
VWPPVCPSVVGRDWASPVSSNKARGCCCRTPGGHRAPLQPRRATRRYLRVRGKARARHQIESPKRPPKKSALGIAQGNNLLKTAQPTRAYQGPQLLRARRRPSAQRYGELLGAGTVTSALYYRIRSCQGLVTGKQQKQKGDKTRTRSGSATRRPGGRPSGVGLAPRPQVLPMYNEELRLEAGSLDWFGLVLASQPRRSDSQARDYPGGDAGAAAGLARAGVLGLRCGARRAAPRQLRSNTQYK